MMSLPTRILVGLVLGLVSGIVISLSPGDTLKAIPLFIEPVGKLWVNAISMTVIPLIVSLLITAIAGEHEQGFAASLGRKTVGLFALMVAVICVYTALAAPPLLALLQFDAATIEALRAPGATLDSSTVVLPPFRDWLVNLIPSNPLRAAAYLH